MSTIERNSTYQAPSSYYGTSNQSSNTQQSSSSPQSEAAAQAIQQLQQLFGTPSSQPKIYFQNGQHLQEVNRQLVAGEQSGSGFTGWLERNVKTAGDIIKAYKYASKVIPGLETSIFGDSAVKAGEAALNGATKGGADLAGSTLGGYASTLKNIGGYAMQAYAAYGVLSSDMTDEQKARELTKQAGLFVADMFTGGAASFAYGTLGQTKEWKKVEEFMYDYDGIGLAAESAGSIWHDGGDFEDHMNIATMGGFEVMGNIMGIDTGHKSTKEYQAERASGAFDAAVTDADKEYVKTMYELKQQAASDNIIRDPSNPYDGQPWRWEEQKPLMKGEDAWGFMGFQEAFPDFISGYTEAIESPAFGSFRGEVIGSNFELTWESEPGEVYRVQKVDTSSRQWSDVSPEIPGDGTRKSFDARIVVDSAYYRLSISE